MNNTKEKLLNKKTYGKRKTGNPAFSDRKQNRYYLWFIGNLKQKKKGFKEQQTIIVQRGEYANKHTPRA